MQHCCENSKPVLHLINAEWPMRLTRYHLFDGPIVHNLNRECNNVCAHYYDFLLQPQPRHRRCCQLSIMNVCCRVCSFYRKHRLACGFLMLFPTSMFTDNAHFFCSSCEMQLVWCLTRFLAFAVRMIKRCPIPPYDDGTFPSMLFWGNIGAGKLIK